MGAPPGGLGRVQDFARVLVHVDEHGHGSDCGLNDALGRAGWRPIPGARNTSARLIESECYLDGAIVFAYSHPAESWELVWRFRARWPRRPIVVAAQVRDEHWVLAMARGITLWDGPPAGAQLVYMIEHQLHGGTFLRVQRLAHAYRLTRREHECLQLAAARFEDKEAAPRFNISVATYRTHLSSAANKISDGSVPAMLQRARNESSDDSKLIPRIDLVAASE